MTETGTECGAMISDFMVVGVGNSVFIIDVGNSDFIVGVGNSDFIGVGVEIVGVMTSGFNKDAGMVAMCV